MRTIEEIKSELEQARADYQSAANTRPAPEVRALSKSVRELQAELAAAITEGAVACKCGAPPHGLEQPTVRGGVEYEIGCTVCTDERFRGGALPKHAVEAWNAGQRIAKKAAV